MGQNYDALSEYDSYDLAWLGPIFFPLSIAIVAQAVIYADLLKHRGKGYGDRRLDALVTVVMVVVEASSLQLLGRVPPSPTMIFRVSERWFKCKKEGRERKA